MRTYYLRVGKGEKYRFEAENDQKAIRNAKRIAGNRDILSLGYMGDDEILIPVEVG